MEASNMVSSRARDIVNAEKYNHRIMAATMTVESVSRGNRPSQRARGSSKARRVDNGATSDSRLWRQSSSERRILYREGDINEARLKPHRHCITCRVLDS